MHPVQHPGPQHGLGLGHVVAEQEQRVTRVDVGVTAGLAVRAETLLHRRGGRGGAQAGVAVHMRCSQARLADHREGVVLLQEQLPTGVETVRQRSGLVQQLPRPPHDQTHRGVPIGLHQFATASHQGTEQPVRAAPLPGTVESLGAQPPVVDHITRPPADPDHAAVLDRDVTGTAVTAQHARRLHPTVHVRFGQPGLQMQVDPNRPGRVFRMRCPCAPDIQDAIGHAIPPPRSARGYPGRRPPIHRRPRRRERPVLTPVSPHGRADTSCRIGPTGAPATFHPACHG